MPKPIDPDAWHPRKPPLEGRDFSGRGVASSMVLAWYWRHKILGAALTLLLALVLVVAIAFALLRVTGGSPAPAQTGPTPTLVPANGGPSGTPAPN
jgi:hypothetical protein